MAYAFDPRKIEPAAYNAGFGQILEPSFCFPSWNILRRPFSIVRPPPVVHVKIVLANREDSSNDRFLVPVVKEKSHKATN